MDKYQAFFTQFECIVTHYSRVGKVQDYTCILPPAFIHTGIGPVCRAYLLSVFL